MAMQEPPEPGQSDEIPPQPAAPGSTRPQPRQPLWVHFLLPAAILVGAAAVAAALLTADNEATVDTDAVAAAVAARLGETGAVTQGGVTSGNGDGSSGDGDGNGSSGATTPATSREAFTSYAAAIGLDGAAFEQCLGTQGIADNINAHLQRGSELGVTGTPTFFINNKRLVGAQPTEVFLEIIDAELNGSPETIDAYSPAIQQLAATSPPRFEILPERPDLSGAAIEGDPDAPVIVAEYSDFECPFCARWFAQTMPALRERLDDGVSLAFLHFPIVSIHPNAGRAAIAAECAGAEGRFWEMHDLLFARQSEWASLPPN